MIHVHFGVDVANFHNEEVGIPSISIQWKAAIKKYCIRAAIVTQAACDNNEIMDY